MKNLQKVGVKQAAKLGMVVEKMTMEEVARATGREIATLSGILSRGNPSIKNTLGIFNQLGAKLIVRYSNGNEVELIPD